MRTRNLLIILTTIFCVLLLLQTRMYAKVQSGTALMLHGNSAAAGIGGAGVASFNEGLFYLNPAAIGNSENTGFGLGYGSLNSVYYNPSLLFWLPSSYGALGVQLDYYSINDSADFDRGAHLSVGGAKGLTSRFFLGTSVDLFYGTAEKSLGFAGVRIGGMYIFQGMKGSGFGFYTPSLGLSVTGGIPFAAKNETDYSDFNKANAGYSVSFYKDQDVTVTFLNDIMYIYNTHSVAVKGGIELALYDHYVFRGGASYPLDNYYGVFTGGAGYRFKTEYIHGAIDYSLQYGEAGWIHTAGISMKYGKPDRKPPRTLVTIDNKYISPNYDGRQDYVIFSITVYDESRIKGWKFQIRDKNKKLIKEYTLTERTILKSLTAGEFFARIFQKKESLIVPESILWDGTDNKGIIVPDGTYSYSFLVWDERNNIAPMLNGKVGVDNTPPEVMVKAEDMLFSPNDDKQKDECIIKQQVKTSDDDTWHAGFKDSKNRIVKSYSWTGKAVPTIVKWDGIGNNGSKAPEGLYTYFIKTMDKAGNSAAAHIPEITLVRAYELADINLSESIISYKRNNNTRFFLRLSSTKGLQKWNVRILNKDKEKTVKEITYPQFKKIITWNFKDNDGNKLDDGVYYVRFESVFSSGNRPRSFAKRLLIDNKKPDLQLSVSPGLFSPDGDQKNDLLIIKTGCDEPFGMKNWKITIYTEQGAVFKKISGTDQPPAVIKWDGYGDAIIGKDKKDTKKEKVMSAGIYYIDFCVTDMAGNTAKTEKQKIKVDILVHVVEEGFRIRVNTISFSRDGGTLTENDEEILDKIYNIVSRYRKYHILIEGHTGSRGREQKNLELSEKMAAAVRNYFIHKGISKKRMRIKGMGETVPVFFNRKDDNKNKRIEFLLFDESKNIKENTLVD